MINGNLTYVEDISDVIDNNFYIVSGNGYPRYKKLIKNGILDVNSWGVFDRLIISVDAEELSYEEKYNEIETYISQFICTASIYIVVQYYCLETWGLGNRIFPRRNTIDEDLRKYYQFFNVVTQDPELLPSINPDNYTRAQFSLKYLHKIINGRNQRLTFSKSNPTVLTHNGYFEQLVSRLNETQHIQSLQCFIDAFL